MLLIYKFALYSHIIAGTIALFLFWYPLFVKKGSPLHNRVGRYYIQLMYVVGWGGALCCALVLAAPLTIRQVDGLEGEELATFLAHTRQFAAFLLTLSLLTLASVYHGVAVLRVKADRQRLKNFPHLALLVSLLVCSLVTIVMGLIAGNGLLIGFSFVGLATAVNNLRYIFKAKIKSREWIIAHIGGLLGSGIGVYTAFSAVGGRHILLELIGNDAIIFSWFAPGVLGVVGIAWASRRFSVRYKIA